MEHPHLQRGHSVKCDQTIGVRKIESAACDGQNRLTAQRSLHRRINLGVQVHQEHDRCICFVHPYSVIIVAVIFERNAHAIAVFDGFFKIGDIRPLCKIVNNHKFIIYAYFTTGIGFFPQPRRFYFRLGCEQKTHTNPTFGRL